MNPLAPVVFLDFDGVLHPDEAYLEPGGPVLRCEDPTLKLFCWAPILEDLLARHPHTQAVLSTSWVRLLGFDEALGWLPPGLQTSVVGATWHSKADQYAWQNLVRGEQVLSYAGRHQLTRWIALDDDGAHWPSAHRHRLVLTDGATGISDLSTREILRKALEAIAGS